MAGLPGLPPPGFADEEQTTSGGLPGLPPPGFAGEDMPQPEENKLLGTVGAVGQGVTFGFADEAAAGLRSGISSIQQYLGMQPRFQDYDSELAAIRGQQGRFAEQNPALNLAGTVAGGLVLPGGLAAKGATLPAKMALAGVEGAATGAAYGFGTGEGGLENRLDNAQTVGTIGAVAGPLVVGGMGAVQKGLGTAAKDLERGALNIQRSDLQKASKYARPLQGEESKLLTSLDGVRERGLFKGSKAPEAIIARNEQFIDDLGGQVTNVLKAADAAQKDVAIPAMTNAQKFINQNPFEADKLAAQYQKRMETLNQAWDGSVSGLNEMKQMLYRIGYDGTTDSKALDRAIARDFKEAVESQAESILGKEAAKQIKSINAQQGEHLTLRDLFAKNQFQGEMPGGVAKALQRATISPLGGSAGLIGYGALTGNPAALAAGAIGSQLATRAGKFRLAGLARAGASVAQGAGNIPSGAIAAGTIGFSEPTRTSQTQAESIPSEIQNTTRILPLPQAERTLATGATPQPVSPRPIVSSQGAGAVDQSSPAKSSLPSKPLFAGSQPVSKNMPKLPKPELEKVVSSVVPEKDRPIMMALIKQESGGNTTAVSKAGAKGLTQLMPAMAKAFGVEDVFDPVQNLQGGYALFQEERERFKDLRLALAAYNAGSPRVRKAIEKADSRDFDEVQAHLPLETREYVRRIMSALA